MKRACVMFAMVFLFLFNTSPLHVAYADKPQPRYDATFVLPASLKSIEEDAFDGSVAKTVIFPDGFQSIGDNAFRNMSFLSDVYIPGTTLFIAQNAFPNNEGFSIHGIEGSYAQRWAEKHDIPFVVDNVWNAISENRKTLYAKSFAETLFLFLFFPKSTVAALGLGPYEKRSRRPQDRPELYPINYRFP